MHVALANMNLRFSKPSQIHHLPIAPNVAENFERSIQRWESSSRDLVSTKRIQKVHPLVLLAAVLVLQVSHRIALIALTLRQLKKVLQRLLHQVNEQLIVVCQISILRDVAAYRH